MNKSIEQLEFRIFHNLFCSTFKIKKDSFAFDEYVVKVFQRSVLELIEIRLLDWFYATVLILLNLGRVKLHVHLRSCHSGNAQCEQKNTILMFTLVGKKNAKLITQVFFVLFCSVRMFFLSSFLLSYLFPLPVALLQVL